ncbi:MAG TPA: arginine deiminase [Sediminispirochaeta sp.]|nr:arginine deiminase [Sediminispirochaeta sp.]
MDFEVQSEIGTLKKVLLHRPGLEIEQLSPRYLPEMLFEDIPWLKKIQEEHDAFAATLRSKGVEVWYYHDLLREVCRLEEARNELIDEVMRECRIGDEGLKGDVRRYLEALDPEKLAEVLITGLRKRELHPEDGSRLAHFIKDAHPFYINPLTNLYFARDPGAMIGRNLSINAMKAPARAREAKILEAIYRHHENFSQDPPELLYQPSDLDSIEGGDILVLGPDTVAVGCSERSSTEGIERLARRLLHRGYRTVLVIQIPFRREYMHLDTVLTMVDRDAFFVFPDIRRKVSMFRLTMQGDEELRVSPLDSLEEALKEALHLPAVRIIESGGDDDLTAAREQWNDSTNTLALAPGRVVTYDRNTASNEILRRNGIEVVEIEGSELVRGRGGPRCMSMPLLREEV